MARLQLTLLVAAVALSTVLGAFHKKCGTLIDGSFTEVSANRNGRRLTYSCWPGFVKLSGTEKHRCRPNKGGWVPGQAQVLQCGCTPLVLGPYVNSQTSPDNAELVLSCQQNYQPLSGSAAHWCESSGWRPGQASVLTCGCPPLEPGRKSEVAYSSLKSVTYRCLSGFEPKTGTATHRCENGAWWPGQKDVLRCKRIDPCKIAPVVDYATSECSLDSKPPSCTYTCDASRGYVIDNKKKQTVICVKTWSPLPACVIKPCRPIPTVKHASRKCTWVKKVGPTDCQYTCKRGYKFKKGVTGATVCRQGRWDPSPVCVDACPSPPSISYGDCSTKCSPNRKKLRTCTCKCDKGYKIADKAFQHITCHMGVWGPPATCVPRKRG